MVGDLQQMRQRAAAATSLTGGSGRSIAGLSERYAARIAANEKRRAEEAERERQLELERLRILAEKDRDKRQQGYEMANTGQRAMYAADAAANEYGYRSKLTKQEEIAQRQRDMLQNRFEEARARQAALEQELRDKRQFGFSQQEDATQFQNTLQRDAVQNQYTKERDRFQNDATLQRDATQFGYQFLRDDLGQQYTLERDVLQDRQQKDRDKLLNQFSTEQDIRQFEQQRERDMLLNDFSTQQDFRQQGFNQENMYQREAAEIAAKWQDQVYEARNAGFDFSEQQRKEMQEMENAFRKNVINGNLTEDVKQRAYVELQRKMSTIIPQERVRHPQETFEQSMVRDPETGQKFMTVRDPKGFDRFEPITTGSSQQYSQEARQQQQELERITKADFERQKEYDALVDRLETEQDADENLKYPTRAEAEAEAMRRFRPYEERYQRAYGLEPLEPYQRAEQQKQEEAKRQQIVQQLQQEREQFRAPGESAGGSMADSLRMRSGDVAPTSRPQPVFQPEPTPTELKQRRQQMQQQQSGGQTPKPQAPVVISSTNFDDHLNKTAAAGDIESAAAMKAIKDIIAKHGGPPPDGSEDKVIFGEAAAFLRAKGVSLQGKTRSQVKRATPNVTRPHPGKL